MYTRKSIFSILMGALTPHHAYAHFTHVKDTRLELEAGSDMAIKDGNSFLRGGKNEELSVSSYAFEGSEWIPNGNSNSLRSGIIFTTKEALIGTRWQLTEIIYDDEVELKPAVVSSHLLLESSDIFSGYNGCNSIGGSIKSLSDTQFELGDIFSTYMACFEGDVAKQERAFMRVINGKRFYQIVGEDSEEEEQELMIFETVVDDDGKEVKGVLLARFAGLSETALDNVNPLLQRENFEGTAIEPVRREEISLTNNPLMGTEWDLAEIIYDDGELKPAVKTVSLLFESTESFSGYDGCNRIWGSLASLSDTQFELGRYASTRMGCRGHDVQELNGAFRKVISRKVFYQIVGQDSAEEEKELMIFETVVDDDGKEVQGALSAHFAGVSETSDKTKAESKIAIAIVDTK